MSAAAVVEKLEPRIRDLGEHDWAFIASSWKKSNRDSEPWLANYQYFALMEREIEQIKARPATRFRVAVDPEDAEFIWAWACSEGTRLHYVYVRQSSRGQGLAHMLARDAGLTSPVTCTHWTEWAAKIATKKPGALIYAPERTTKP